MLTDPDCEKRYLSRCLLEPQTIDTIPVQLDDLASPKARSVAAAMRAIRARGEALDTSTLAIELGDRPDRDATILALASIVETEAGARAAAERIQDLALARRGRHHSLAAAAAFEAGDRPRARSELDLAASETSREGDASSIRRAVEAAVVELYQRASNKRPPYVATGIKAIDSVIGGMEYGDLWVIGGDTSVGKSSTALYMALLMDAAGHRPGIVSCEDPEARVGRRVVSALSGIPAVALRRGDLNEWQRSALSGAVQVVVGTNIHVCYRLGEELPQVAAAIAMLRRQCGCDVIIIDYAQAIMVPGTDERIAMRDIMAAVKRECNRGGNAAVGILLSQLHRREDPHEQPSRHNLHGSGYLEQKADGIVLLWKDEAGLVNGVLDKAKDDPTGAVFVLERDAGGRLREVA